MAVATPQIARAQKHVKAAERLDVAYMRVLTASDLPGVWPSYDRALATYREIARRIINKSKAPALPPTRAEADRVKLALWYGMAEAKSRLEDERDFNRPTPSEEIDLEAAAEIASKQFVEFNCAYHRRTEQWARTARERRQGIVRHWRHS